MNPTEILDLVDRLDVPTLAILVVFGFWKLHQTFNRALGKNQDAFVGALQAIEKRLAVQSTEAATVAESFKEHVRHDREDNDKIFSKIDDTRKETRDAIDKLRLELRAN